MPTIFERALEYVVDGSVVGLGSGRAANRFTESLGARVRAGLNVRGVATSRATAELAAKVGVPLVSLEPGMQLSVAVDGADEVDPQLDLIKGYGRAMLRERVVAASARRFVILVGREKLVGRLGERGKMPLEVASFAVPVCLDRLRSLGYEATLVVDDGRPFVTDNGNHAIDCRIGPIDDARRLQQQLRSIPGLVDTGLFLDAAHIVLIGGSDTFELEEERRRPLPS